MRRQSPDETIRNQQGRNEVIETRRHDVDVSATPTRQNGFGGSAGRLVSGDWVTGRDGRTRN